MDKLRSMVFDRMAEDAGNILSLEHCNIRIPEQRPATLFFIEGLGLTRDPYMHVTDANMWVNVGRNQFHLPTNVRPQVFRGEIGVVVPHFDLVRARLPRLTERLSGTRFSWHDEGDTLRAVCPWGNHVRIHKAGSFGRMVLGIPYVAFPVPMGAAEAIGRFYAEVLKARVGHARAGGARAVEVRVGVEQVLRFVETEVPIAPFDGHHVAIYVADFSSPHHWLAQRGLVTEESDAWQYRFDAIVDPASGAQVFQLEHEVRSLSHPMYPRHLSLVNRNPEQSQGQYQPGRDAWYAPEAPPA